MKHTVYPLFASPVLVCAERFALTAAETNYIDELVMIENIGNLMSKNDRVLEGEVLQRLAEFVDRHISNYKKNLLRIKDENEVYVTQSWVNVSMPGHFHPRHKHPNSIVSGVLFLDNNDDCALPPLRFHRAHEALPLDFDYEELNDFNASCREIVPEEGMLVLFPSNLEHDVGRNDTRRPRRSLSFNTYVRGVVGGRGQLTEVVLR